MREEWRATHHPDYEVSNLGRVRSYVKPGRFGGRLEQSKILKPIYPGKNNRGGYATVQFGRANFQLVHRLVIAAFVEPVPEGLEVMHKDDNKTNPRLDNLTLGTHQRNLQDAVLRGRHRGPMRQSRCAA